jgi:hypothetical protein
MSQSNYKGNPDHKLFVVGNSADSTPVHITLYCIVNMGLINYIFNPINKNIIN